MYNLHATIGVSYINIFGNQRFYLIKLKLVPETENIKNNLPETVWMTLPYHREEINILLTNSSATEAAQRISVVWSPDGRFRMHPELSNQVDGHCQ